MTIHIARRKPKMSSLIIDLSGQTISGDDELNRAIEKATAKQKRAVGDIEFNFALANVHATGDIACNNRTGNPPNNLPTDSNSGNILIRKDNYAIVNAQQYNVGNHAAPGLRVELILYGASITCNRFFCNNIAWN